MASDLLKQVEFFNNIIAQQNLPISPFNERGLSVNPLMKCCVFMFIDHYHDCLRLYVKLAELSHEKLEQGDFFVKLLSLMNPAREYTCLSVGLTNPNKLWASNIVKFSNLNEVTFQDYYEQFIEQAQDLKDKVGELLFSSSYTSSITQPQEHKEDTSSPKVLSEQEDLMQLMASSQVFFG